MTAISSENDKVYITVAEYKTGSKEELIIAADDCKDNDKNTTEPVKEDVPAKKKINESNKLNEVSRFDYNIWSALCL
jgi:hypothetical protein